MNEISFGQAVADSAVELFPNAKKLRREKTRIDADLSEAIAGIDIADTTAALSTLDKVISAVKKGGSTLTLEAIDRALDASDGLVKQAKKDAGKETREFKQASSELKLTDHVVKLIGIDNPRVKKARKEGKEAVRAQQKSERSREQNELLDEEIDEMIIRKLKKADPTFKALVDNQDRLTGLLDSVDVLIEDAQSLSSAATIDAVVNVDLKNPGLNAAMEMAQNLSVQSAQIDVRAAARRVEKQLGGYSKWIDNMQLEPSALSVFADAIDVPLEFLDSGSMFGFGDTMDMIGGLVEMDRASQIGTAARRMYTQFEHNLESTERSIMAAVEKVRKNLQLQ